jgi:phage FluMu protein Com
MVGGKAKILKERRCIKCGGLLFKEKNNPSVQIKCRKCKYVNNININS